MTVKKLKELKNSLMPFLKHMGQTPEEQLQKNQAAMKLLQKWIEEEVSEEESQHRQNLFDSFKKIIDSERQPGQKLYTQE